MRPRRTNIPTDLTNTLEVKKNQPVLDRFVSEVRNLLEEAGVNASNLSVPNIDDLITIEQKPELLRETLVRLENRNG